MAADPGADHQPVLPRPALGCRLELRERRLQLAAGRDGGVRGERPAGHVERLGGVRRDRVELLPRVRASAVADRPAFGVVERGGALLGGLHDRGDESLARHPLAVDVDRLCGPDPVGRGVHQRELRRRLAALPAEHQPQDAGQQGQQEDHAQAHLVAAEHRLEAQRPRTVLACGRRDVHPGLQGHRCVRRERAGPGHQGAAADPAHLATGLRSHSDGAPDVVTVRRQVHGQRGLHDAHLPAAGDQVPVELRPLPATGEHPVDGVADDVGVLAVHGGVGGADLDVAVAAVAFAEHLERLGLPVAGDPDVVRDQPRAVVTGVGEVEEPEDPVLVDRVVDLQRLDHVEPAVARDGEVGVVVVDGGDVGVRGATAPPVGERGEEHQSPEDDQCDQPDQPSPHTRRLLTFGAARGLIVQRGHECAVICVRHG